MARRRIGTGGVGTDMGSVKDVSAGEHSWNVKSSNNDCSLVVLYLSYAKAINQILYAKSFPVSTT